MGAFEIGQLDLTIALLGVVRQSRQEEVTK